MNSRLNETKYFYKQFCWRIVENRLSKCPGVDVEEQEKQPSSRLNFKTK